MNPGMKKDADTLLPSMLAPLVAGTIFASRIHHVQQTNSTNALAMEAAAAGAPEGSAFFAEEQVAGRGRGGHIWHSERGSGIYCSVVLRPQRWLAGDQPSPISPGDALVLSLSSGLASQSALEEVSGIHPDLRWPNDLLLNGKKLGGILVELNAEAARVRYVVVGIGLNVNQEEFPPGLEAVATSLRRETGRRWPRLELAAALLKSLDREYRVFCADGRNEILRRFEASSSYVRGKKVRVEENGFQGVTEGLDERGFLRVRTNDGLRIVLSGGVREQNE
jgi:BirA family biotin operon repressor/biotin-[acetyl-CoA-carboxylase] ligase